MGICKQRRQQRKCLKVYNFNGTVNKNFTMNSFFQDTPFYAIIDTILTSQQSITTFLRKNLFKTYDKEQ